jgi:hypothetical protein
MKNLFIFIIFILFLGCAATPQNTTTEIIKYVTPGVELGGWDGYTFSPITPESQVIFDDWVYVGHNSNISIPLDLASVAGSDTYDCIAVIRVESIAGVEPVEGGVTEWCNGGIRKPNVMLPWNSFSVFKDVQIFEVILWADENGQLEIKFDFDWPYEKRQELKVSFMQYAKTK